MVKTLLPEQGAQVQSLVRELKFHLDIFLKNTYTHTHTHTHTPSRAVLVVVVKCFIHPVLLQSKVLDARSLVQTSA